VRGGLALLRAWIDQTAAHWEGSFDRLDQMLATPTKEKTDDRPDRSDDQPVA
jgi:hypothetical protein